MIYFKPKPGDIGYAVYWNVGTSSGGIERVQMDNAWTPENPTGWTFQHIGGMNDTCQGVFASKEEAEEILLKLKLKS